MRPTRSISICISVLCIVGCGSSATIPPERDATTVTDAVVTEASADDAPPLSCLPLDDAALGAGWCPMTNCGCPLGCTTMSGRKFLDGPGCVSFPETVACANGMHATLTFTCRMRKSDGAYYQFSTDQPPTEPAVPGWTTCPPDVELKVVSAPGC